MNKKDIEVWFVGGLMTLVFIGFYNTFLKSVTPTFARNFIGLG